MPASPAPNHATRAAEIHTAVTQPPREPDGGRAADVASRLRALNERARHGTLLGGGFGPRVQADGTVLLTLPFSRRATSVVGPFNNWDAQSTPFVESADRRRLEAVVALGPGTHAYRVVVDGHEMLDEFNNLRDESVGANIVVVPGAREGASTEAASTLGEGGRP